MPGSLTRLCGLVMALSFLPLGARGEAPGELKLSTERVVVFKDGHGLFVKQARGQTDKSGELWTQDLPEAASLGSFWVSDADDSITQVVAGQEVVREESRVDGPCRNPVEVLAANKGKQAELHMSDGSKHRGRIRSLLEPGQAKCGSGTGPAASLASSILSARLDQQANPQGHICDERARAQHLVLRTEEGDLLLPTGQIRSLRITGMKLACSFERHATRKVKRLRLRYAKQRSGRAHALTLMYFRPGIRWIPTYRVELGADGNAELTLQAEVLNEAEDLDGPVDFVVGLPTFRFGAVVSPMVLESVLRNSLAAAAPQLMNQLASNPLSNAQFHSRAGERHRPVSDSGMSGGGQITRAMEGQELQDLYTYSVPRLRLRKGERALVELLRVRVPFRHLYTWEPQLGASQAAQSGYTNSPLRLEKNSVWHQVVLKNNSGRPWTTGPALVMQDGRAVGQDLMTFTPAGNEVELPMTAAVSLRASFEEEEVRRTQGAKRVGSRRYTRVDIKARLKIRNSTGRKTPLLIRSQVPGRVLKAAGAERIQAIPTAPGQYEAFLHHSGRVVHAVSLKPGQRQELEILYQRYLRE